jgi:uncharacterized protein YbjT (DUF2867 family)
MTRRGPLAAVRATVVGGSLGGLTCALLLRDLGVEVEVFERSESPLAALFAQGPELAGRSIGIAGEHLSGAQMAASLARALGEPVRHQDMSRAQYAALGFAGAGDLANMFSFKREFGDDYRARRGLEATRALHPEVLNFDAWLACHATRIPVPAVAHRA